MKRVVIVGGGISGLTAAHALQPHARAGRIEVELLEASHRLGGKIRTEMVDGCMIEHGPDMFLTRKPELVELCAELGLPLQFPRATARRTGIVRDGRLHELPGGFTGVVPGRLLPLLRSRLLSPRARLRLLIEPLVPAWRGDDISVARFLSRRIGREAYARLVAPLLAGVYGDGETLSTDATLPELRALEARNGSLARGVRARQRAMPDAPFASVAGGLQSITDALAARLDGVALHGATRARSIARNGAAYTIETDEGSVDADGLILALPANGAAPLVAAMDVELGEALGAIPHESVAAAILAYDVPDVPRAFDAHGWLIPAAERRPVRAVTCITSKFEGRAPAGVALFRVFFTMPDAVDASDDVLLRDATDELARTLGIRATPRLTRVVRWREELPRYTLGHPRRVAVIDEALARLPGLHMAGPSLRGAGLPDSVRAARSAARAALSHLGLE